MSKSLFSIILFLSLQGFSKANTSDELSKAANQIRLHAQAETALAARFDLLDAATKMIDIETFYLEKDEVGLNILKNSSNRNRKQLNRTNYKYACYWMAGDLNP